MKTTLTIFTVLAVLYNVGFAQDEDVLRPRGGGRMSGSSSSGSTPIMLGIEAGINYNMFSQTITGLAPDSRFAVFESGSGISPFIGAFFDIGLSHNLGIQVKLAYDQKKFGNTKDAIRNCQVADPVFGFTVVDAQITGEYTNTISYLDFTPQLRWNVTPEFFVLVGPTAHFKIGNASQTFTETIKTPGECYYGIGTPDQSKTFTASSDSIPVNSSRFGAQLDLGYKFKLSPTIFLVPKLGFQYMFTALSDDQAGFDDSKRIDNPPQPTTGIVPITLTDRALHSLQFSLGLWFQL